MKNSRPGFTKAGRPPAPLLFLVGRGAAGAEDGDDDDDDDGDDAHGHDDHQQHVAVQGGCGAAMGAVTAWEGWGGEKRLVYDTGKASSAHQRHLESCRSARGDGSHEKCLVFGICQLFLYNCSAGSWFIDPFPTKSITI